MGPRGWGARWVQRAELDWQAGLAGPAGRLEGVWEPRRGIWGSPKHEGGSFSEPRKPLQRTGEQRQAPFFGLKLSSRLFPAPIPFSPGLWTPGCMFSSAKEALGLTGDDGTFRLSGPLALLPAGTQLALTPRSTVS